MQAEPTQKTFDGRFDVLSRWWFVEPQNETWTFAKLQPRQTNGGDAKSCDHSRHVMWEPVWRHAEVAFFPYVYLISFSRLSPCGPKCPRAACSTIIGVARFLCFLLKGLDILDTCVVDAGCKVWVDSTSKSTVRHVSREWQVWVNLSGDDRVRNFNKHL